MTILIEAFRYFIVRIRIISIFISALILYLFSYKAGNKAGKYIMKLYKRFKK